MAPGGAIRSFRSRLISAVWTEEGTLGGTLLATYREYGGLADGGRRVCKVYAAGTTCSADLTNCKIHLKPLYYLGKLRACGLKLGLACRLLYGEGLKVRSTRSNLKLPLRCQLPRNESHFLLPLGNY